MAFTDRGGFAVSGSGAQAVIGSAIVIAIKHAVRAKMTLASKHFFSI
jgi:hypothetical protein